MPRWLIITGIGCGVLLMLVLVGVGTLFFIAVEEELRKGPTQEESPAQEEPAASEAADTVTINVKGDLPFSCSLSSMRTSRTVEGDAPASFELPVDPSATVDMASAICNKRDHPGMLGVELVYEGEVRVQNETTAEYGSVSVIWNTSEA